MSHIEFHGVQKSFGPKIVYRDLTLAIERGEVITVIGGSGAGKSVMLKCLIGLMRPDAGEILFDGKNVVGLEGEPLQRVRQRIGMLFQGAALFDSMPVEDNVAYGLREHLRLTKDEIHQRVARALEMVGMPGVQKMRPPDLSGGMKKRVGLARAIALEPEVVCYDEPTTGLDPINVTRINRLIVSLNERLKITSIVVTHDMVSAFQVSDRLAMLHDGRIVSIGTPSEIQADPRPEVQDFIQGTVRERISGVFDGV